jgi:hypothetical protein
MYQQISIGAFATMRGVEAGQTLTDIAHNAVSADGIGRYSRAWVIAVVRIEVIVG